MTSSRQAVIAPEDLDRSLAPKAWVSLAVYADFVHRVSPPKHARLWLARLQHIAEHPDQPARLLIVAPPGHAKSSYLSQVFPTWYLGRNPEASILHFTSSDSLAYPMHTLVRQVLEENARHRLVFPGRAYAPGEPWNFQAGLRLRGAKERISYRMASYGSRVLGLRASLIIMDDPLDQVQSESETNRQAAKRYLDSTIFPRGQPDASVICVCTRWHWDDLAQHMIDRWGFEVIYMPALGYWDAEGLDGGALWPEYWPIEALQRIRDGMTEEQFLMVYQGLPTPPGGAALQPSLVQELPDVDAEDDEGKTLRDRFTNTVQYYDLAFAERPTGSRPSYTAGATLATDGQAFYLLDLYRGRPTASAFEDLLCERYERFRPEKIGIERVSASEWVIQALQNKLPLPLTGIGVSNEKKAVRAELLAAKLQRGLFYADKSAPYWNMLQQEMAQFPQGATTDMVDAIAGATRLLSGSWRAKIIGSYPYVSFGSPGGPSGEGQRPSEKRSLRRAERRRRIEREQALREKVVSHAL